MPPGVFHSLRWLTAALHLWHQREKRGLALTLERSLQPLWPLWSFLQYSCRCWDAANITHREVYHVFHMCRQPCPPRMWLALVLQKATVLSDGIFPDRCRNERNEYKHISFYKSWRSEKCDDALLINNVAVVSVFEGPLTLKLWKRMMEKHVDTARLKVKCVLTRVCSGPWRDSNFEKQQFISIMSVGRMPLICYPNQHQHEGRTFLFLFRGGRWRGWAIRTDPYSLIWIISSRHLDLRVSRLSEESVWWLCFIVPEGQDLQSSPSVLRRAPGQQLSEYTRLCVFIREER